MTKRFRSYYEDACTKIRVEAPDGKTIGYVMNEIDADNICDLLNSQDARIKELEHRIRELEHDV